MRGERAAGGARRRRSATRRSCWPTGSRTRADTWTPLAGPCWCRRSTPDRSSAPIEHDGARGGGARLRRGARRRSRDGRGRPCRSDDGAGERAPAGGVGGAARRGAGVAPAHRRGRRRGAPPARARSARRRAAAPRRDRSAAADDPLRHPARPRARPSSSRRAASDELAQSLEELRELARGIHPASLDHGLAAALDSLARARDGAARRCRATRRSTSPGRRARRLLRGLRGAGQRRQVRRGDDGVGPPVAHAGRRGRSRSPTTGSVARTRRAGPASTAWRTASRRWTGSCSSRARAGRER